MSVCLSIFLVAGACCLLHGVRSDGPTNLKCEVRLSEDLEVQTSCNWDKSDKERYNVLIQNSTGNIVFSAFLNRKQSITVKLSLEVLGANNIYLFLIQANDKNGLSSPLSVFLILIAPDPSQVGQIFHYPDTGMSSVEVSRETMTTSLRMSSLSLSSTFLKSISKPRLVITPTPDVPKAGSLKVPTTMKTSILMNTPSSSEAQEPVSSNAVGLRRQMSTTTSIPAVLSSVNVALRMSFINIPTPSAVSHASSLNSPKSSNHTTSSSITQRLMTISTPTFSKACADSKETFWIGITGALVSIIVILIILVIVLLQLMLKYKHRASESTKGMASGLSVFLKKNDVAEDVKSASGAVQSDYFYVDLEGEVCQVSAANLTCNEGYTGRAVHVRNGMDANEYAMPSDLVGSMDVLCDSSL